MLPRPRCEPPEHAHGSEGVVPTWSARAQPPAPDRRLGRGDLFSPDYPDARLSTQYVIVFIATGLLTLLALAVFLAVAIPVTVRKRQPDLGSRAYFATPGCQSTPSTPGVAQHNPRRDILLR